MLAIGEQFPSYSLTATVSTDNSDKAFKTITDQDYAGKWKVYFFWPKDFTFVCPTEIAAFGKLNKEFLDRDTQILGGSIDSEFVHGAWRVHHEDLHNLPFPMLADIKRDLCETLGILDPKAGVAQRATFVVDPEGVIRFVMVTDLSVGRNPQEVLRVLDAFRRQQTAHCGSYPCQRDRGLGPVRERAPPGLQPQRPEKRHAEKQQPARAVNHRPRAQPSQPLPCVVRDIAPHQSHVHDHAERNRRQHRRRANRQD